MQLHDNPNAVAEAARISAEEGFDPLDYDVINAALHRYRRYFWISLGWGWVFAIPFVLGGCMVAAGVSMRHDRSDLMGSLIMAAALFAIAWFPGGWGYRRAFRRHRDRTLRVIHGYVSCLRAAYDDPGEARREEMRWRQAHGLFFLRYSRGPRPEGISSHRKGHA